MTTKTSKKTKVAAEHVTLTLHRGKKKLSNMVLTSGNISSIRDWLDEEIRNNPCSTAEAVIELFQTSGLMDFKRTYIVHLTAEVEAHGNDDAWEAAENLMAKLGNIGNVDDVYES